MPEVTAGELLPACVCGEVGGATGGEHGIPIVTCPRCGIVRQRVEMTEAELAEWYRTEYSDPANAEGCTHTLAQDQAVAEIRRALYAIPAGARLLDVGCGNGAFVAEMRTHGVDAWGQDLAAQSAAAHVFVGSLHDVAFPTDHFDVVTMHDVLEHVVDPMAFLREVVRITKPGGRVIVDFPRFWHPAGVHHWKRVQHLWMFTNDQLGTLMQACGLKVRAVSHPIPSKVVMVGERAEVERPRILVPAGIGDSYWVLTKLPGFLKAHGYGPEVTPEMWVQDAGGPRRTQPFLNTVPLVHAAGYVLTGRDRTWRATWQEAYMQDGRTHFRGVAGVDHFLAYNGVMRHGKSLAAVDAEWGVEWRPRMHVSKEAARIRDALQYDGPYVVAYFVSSGMYKQWLAEFPPAHILATLRALRDKVGRVVFVGAEWDKESAGQWLASQEPASASWVNLIAQTTYDELAGVIRGASAVVGWPSGASLLGPVWNVPTALVWNRYFRSEFWTNAAPPDAPYAVLDSRQLTPERYVETTLALIEAQRNG